MNYNIIRMMMFLQILFSSLVQFSTTEKLIIPQISFHPGTTVKEGDDVIVNCEIELASNDDTFIMYLFCPLQTNYQCLEDCHYAAVNSGDEEYLKSVSTDCSKILINNRITYRYKFSNVDKRLSSDAGFYCRYKGSSSPKHKLKIASQNEMVVQTNPTAITTKSTLKTMDKPVEHLNTRVTYQPSKLDRISTSKSATARQRSTTTNYLIIEYKTTRPENQTTQATSIIISLLNYVNKIPGYIIIIIMSLTGISLIIGIILSIRCCLISKYSKVAERHPLEKFCCMSVEAEGLHQIRFQRNVDQSTYRPQSHFYDEAEQLINPHIGPCPTQLLQGVSPGRRSSSVSRKSDQSGGRQQNNVKTKYGINRSVPQGLNYYVAATSNQPAYPGMEYNYAMAANEAQMYTPESRRALPPCPPYKRLSQSQPKLNYLDQCSPLFIQNNQNLYIREDVSQAMYATQQVPMPLTLVSVPQVANDSPVMQPHYSQSPTQDPSVYYQPSQQNYGKASLTTGYVDSD